jgi:hypothetical protein
MLYIFNPIRIKSGTKDVHEELTDYEYCEDTHNENHALPRCMNKSVSKLPTFIIWFG